MADGAPQRTISAFEFEEPARDAPSRRRSASEALAEGGFLGMPKRSTIAATYALTPRPSQGSFVERQFSSMRDGDDANVPSSFERQYDQLDQNEAVMSLARRTRLGSVRSSSSSSPVRRNLASFDPGGTSPSRRRRGPSDVGGFGGAGDGSPDGSPVEPLSPGAGLPRVTSASALGSFPSHTDETMLQLPTRRMSGPRLRLATYEEGTLEQSGEVERRLSGQEFPPPERQASHYTGLAASFAETERDEQAHTGLASSFSVALTTSDEPIRIPSRGPSIRREKSIPQISEAIQKERKRAEGHHWAPNALEFDRKAGWIHKQHESDEGDDKAARWRLWLLVITAAFLAASISFVLSFGSVGLQHFVQDSQNDEWTAWEIFFYRQALMMLLPVAGYVFSVVLTFHHPISIMQFVGGSGIPELKCEMTGVHLVGVFHWRVVVAKMTGLICCAGASLPVGMEGPFVHLAASIGHALTMKIGVFKPLRYSNMLRNMALTAMIAVGLACSFAAPVGGTLYAVELLDGFGSVGYLHCFLGATAAWTCVEFATWFTQVVIEGMRTGDIPDEEGTVVPKELFTINGTFASHDDVDDRRYWGMFLAYLVLGVFCGLLGSVFVRLHRRMVLAVKSLCTVGGSPSSPPPVVETSLPGTIDEIGGRFCTCGAVMLDGTAVCQTCGKRWSVVGMNIDGSVEMAPTVSFTHSASMDASPVDSAELPKEQEELTPEEANRAAAAAATAAAAAAPPKPRQKKTYVAFLVAMVATFNALLTYFVPLLRNQTQGEVLNALISEHEIPWGWDAEDQREAWLMQLSPAWLLFGCVCLKLVTTVMVLGLPLPVGSIAPTFVLGAFVGRLFGEMLRPLCGFVLSCDENYTMEARLALVGSCAFCAGTFRSLAQVIMVFELTGLTEMLIPLCASSLVAIFTANSLGINFFESAIQLKSLPHLPALATGRGKLSVGDIMDTQVPVLPPQITAEELDLLRSRFPDWQYEVPIVMRANWDSSHDESDSQEVGEVQFVLVAAVPQMPPAQPPGTILDLWQEVQSVPLQVPAHTILKDLLPMLKHMEKSVAFVTKSGYLKGAVTLSHLYKRAVNRPLPPKISKNVQDKISRTARQSAFAINGRRRSGPI